MNQNRASELRMLLATDGKGGISLDDLVELLPDAALVLDEDGAVLAVNHRALDLFNRERTDFIGELLEFAAAEGETQDISIPRADGLRLGAMQVARFIWDANPCTLATIRDVTKRRRSEQALWQSEANLAAAQRIAAVGSSALDLRSGETSLSDNFGAIFGFDVQDRDEWPGIWQAIVPPEERCKLDEQDVAARDGNKPGPIEFTFVHGHTGERRIATRDVDLVFDEEYGPVSVLAVVRDVTDIRLAEARSRDLNNELERRVAVRTEELREINADLEAFASSMSHDLRTPLRAIDWMVQSLLEDDHVDLGAAVRERLEAIADSVTRAGTLIADLLAYSQVSRGLMRRLPIAANALVDDVVAQVTAANPQFRGEIVHSDLGVVLGDPALVRLAFQNLVENAVKFSAGAEAPLIAITGLPQGSDRQRFCVHDNGVGFDMAYADKLFAVCQQLHPKAQYGGNGMGLAIVERVVRRLGGEIWAESHPGEGASFYFTLKRPTDWEPALPVGAQGQMR